MVFNLNIVDLTIVIQFHHVRNISDKDYSFFGFLSVRQHQVKYN